MGDTEQDKKHIILNNFKQRFPTEDSCLKLLSEKKWSRGFVCRKCGHTNYCKGKKPYSRRCTRCKTEESVTAHTIYHRCKIPLTEALEITMLSCLFADISSYELSRLLGRRHMTCYNFQKKIKECVDGKRDDKFVTEVVTEIKDAIK